MGAQRRFGWFSTQHRPSLEAINPTTERHDRPVSMWEEEEQGWLAFTMPSAYAMEHLPQPNDAALCWWCEQATVAVLSFSG